MGVKDFIFDLVEGGKNINLFGGDQEEVIEMAPTPGPGEFIPSDAGKGLGEGEPVRPLGDTSAGTMGQMKEGIVTSFRDLDEVKSKQLHESLAAEGATLSPDNKAFESLPKDGDIFQQEDVKLSPEEEYENEVLAIIKGANLNSYEAWEYREWLKGHEERLARFEKIGLDPLHREHEAEPGVNAQKATNRFYQDEMSKLEMQDWGKKVGSYIKGLAEEQNR